jgi:hypothetical protein
VLRRPTRQLKLAGARQSLDAGLFAKRSRAVGHRYDCCQLDRTAAPCVATCGAGAMGGQSPLNVGRPAAVKAVVGAPEQVDVGHAGSFAGGPRSPAAVGFCFVREAVVARIVAELLRATGATVVGHLPVGVVPPEDHVDAERDERRATPAEGRSRILHRMPTLVRRCAQPQRDHGHRKAYAALRAAAVPADAKPSALAPHAYAAPSREISSPASASALSGAGAQASPDGLSGSWQAAKSRCRAIRVKGPQVKDDLLLHGIAALCRLNSYARDLVSVVESPCRRAHGPVTRHPQSARCLSR